jgi:predicted small lipoprotein YifL
MPKPLWLCPAISDIRMVLQNKRLNKSAFCLQRHSMIKYCNLAFCENVMPKLFFSVVIMCITYTALSGCGTKKALYLPEQRYPQESNKQAPVKNAPKPSQDASSPTKAN